MHPIGLSLFTFADATHTPHGDDNEFSTTDYSNYLKNKDATHTPHGDDNIPKNQAWRTGTGAMQLIPLTGTITFYSLPDGERRRQRMQLIPLTGTITFHLWGGTGTGKTDATHTPHGDDNYWVHSQRDNQHY